MPGSFLREDLQLSLSSLVIVSLFLVAFFFLPPLGPNAPLIHNLWALGSAFVISFLLTYSLISLAPRLGLVDQPNARKVHTQPTPRAGGLAIFLAFLGASLMTLPDIPLLLMLGLGFLIVVLGLLDDLRPLPWQLRLAVQFVAAGLAVYFMPPGLSWPLRLAGVFWIVALINAFNMLDNMDALSAGVAWIAAAGFASLLLLGPGAAFHSEKAWPYLLLMAALLGFLWFNRPPARIFMGDAGSTFLGLFLGVRSLEDIALTRLPPQNWLVPLCILAVPWYDLVCVVTLRLWRGHSPFHADKQHISHRLVAQGLPSPTAVRVIYLLGLASGLGGLALDALAPPYSWLLAIQLGCWWLAVAVIEYFPHYRSRALPESESKQLT